ncbi:MAG: hypothetical protein Q7T03_04680 [Deltaproteobacteria bacterium]|nr:hypothetical protein [Deltaproteobacteria bacterium]
MFDERIQSEAPVSRVVETRESRYEDQVCEEPQALQTSAPQEPEQSFFGFLYSTALSVKNYIVSTFVEVENRVVVLIQVDSKKVLENASKFFKETAGEFLAEKKDGKKTETVTEKLVLQTESAPRPIVREASPASFQPAPAQNVETGGRIYSDAAASSSSSSPVAVAVEPQWTGAMIFNNAESNVFSGGEESGHKRDLRSVDRIKDPIRESEEYFASFEASSTRNAVEVRMLEAQRIEAVCNRVAQSMGVSIGIPSNASNPLDVSSHQISAGELHASEMQSLQQDFPLGAYVSESVFASFLFDRISDHGSETFVSIPVAGASVGVLVMLTGNTAVDPDAHFPLLVLHPALIPVLNTRQQIFFASSGSGTIESEKILAKQESPGSRGRQQEEGGERDRRQGQQRQQPDSQLFEEEALA